MTLQKESIIDTFQIGNIFFLLKHHLFKQQLVHFQNYVALSLLR